MKRQLMKFTTRILITFAIVLGAAYSAQSATVNDQHGREWRQLTDLRGFTWEQVAASCPQDGVSPCTGLATDWVWATDSQTVELFSYFAPEILPSGSTENFFAAETFLSTFQPTFSFCITYACGAYGAGWTASLDPNGLPIFGAVGWDTTPVSISGGLGVGPAASGAADSFRGVFLWRATGANDGTVHAYDDFGVSPSPFGGFVVNVLTNDWVAGQPATSANATVTPLTSAAGLTLLADGSVMAAIGMASGTYSFSYRICSIAAPANCDDADVSISVGPFAMVPSTDIATVSTSGVAIANVLANDTLGGALVTSAIVTLRQVSASDPLISLNTTTGAVSLATSLAFGTYSLVYEVCEKANPTNCAQTSAIVTLIPYSIDAVNDVFPKISSKTGGTTTSVLANDRFNNATATTTKVQITLLSTLIKGITFNSATGTFTVKAKTRSGTYTITYKICEIANPTNCDTATATLDLSGGV